MRIITYVSIPSTVEKISPDAFDGCTNLPQIDVDENNKNYCSVDGVIYSKDMTEIVIYPNGKKGDSYTLPDSVKTMDSAFMYCDNLKIVKFSSSMTQIDDYMFDNVRHFKRL